MMTYQTLHHILLSLTWLTCLYYTITGKDNSMTLAYLWLFVGLLATFELVALW